MHMAVDYTLSQAETNQHNGNHTYHISLRNALERLHQTTSTTLVELTTLVAFSRQRSETARWELEDRPCSSSSASL